jgi:hypothetical protein
MKIVFEGKDTFEAEHKAVDWCRARGISVGQMQGDAPRGLLFGDFLISKWRGMNRAEIKALHGTIDGPGRMGPVTVTIKPEFEHLLAGVTEEPKA